MDDSSLSSFNVHIMNVEDFCCQTMDFYSCVMKLAPHKQCLQCLILGAIYLSFGGHYIDISEILSQKSCEVTAAIPVTTNIYTLLHECDSGK